MRHTDPAGGRRTSRPGPGQWQWARRGAYIVPALVGENRSSTGIDMTPELLEVANSHVNEFTQALGYLKPNMKFVEGHLEDLVQAWIASQSTDIVISNCVRNLSPQKQQVLREVHRVLRDGGEFYFSDTYATRRLPDSVKSDPVLHGECLGGALYVEDFKRMCRAVGFGEPRELSTTPVAIGNEAFEDKVGAMTKFYSITLRCFKMESDVVEPGHVEEDCGQITTYLGDIPGYPHVYAPDDRQYFETQRPMRVGGNTAAILKHSWLSKYFQVSDDRTDLHFGVFKGD